jgi:hypothetical protein
VLSGSLSPRHGTSSGCGCRNSLQLWSVAVNALNKLSQTAEKRLSSSFGVWAMSKFQTNEYYGRKFEVRKKAITLKLHETILRTTEVEEMYALHKHIFREAENVSNRCSSMFIPFDCRTYVERSRTHTVLVYTLLRQPQHNYRSRLITRISLPPFALTLSLPLPLHLLSKFLYTPLPSLTIQPNVHPFLTS